jgi:hypothetical protein
MSLTKDYISFDEAEKVIIILALGALAGMSSRDENFELMRRALEVSRKFGVTYEPKTEEKP